MVSCFNTPSTFLSIAQPNYLTGQNPEFANAGRRLKFSLFLFLFEIYLKICEHHQVRSPRGEDIKAQEKKEREEKKEEKKMRKVTATYHSVYVPTIYIICYVVNIFVLFNSSSPPSISITDKRIYARS